MKACKRKSKAEALTTTQWIPALPFWLLNGGTRCRRSINAFCSWSNLWTNVDPGVTSLERTSSLSANTFNCKLWNSLHGQKSVSESVYVFLIKAGSTIGSQLKNKNEPLVFRPVKHPTQFWNLKSWVTDGIDSFCLRNVHFNLCSLKTLKNWPHTFVK